MTEKSKTGRPDTRVEVRSSNRIMSRPEHQEERGNRWRALILLALTLVLAMSTWSEQVLNTRTHCRR